METKGEKPESHKELEKGIGQPVKMRHLSPLVS